MPRGGRREGAGRKPGEVPKAKRDLADMAKGYAEDALMVLVRAMGDETVPASARISAATALLDRGYGKPAQAVAHGQDPENPLPASITLNIIRPGEQS